MNIEYRWLSDNEVEVVDGIGQRIKRVYDKNNIQDVLLLENKIEMMDNRLDDLNKRIYENEKVIWLSNKMLKFQPFMILICTLISSLYGFISGGLSHVSEFMTYAIYNGLYNGVQGLLWSLVAVSVVSIYFVIVKLIYKKNIKKNQIEKNILRDLRKQYEKELTMEIQKQHIVSESFSKMIVLPLCKTK